MPFFKAPLPASLCILTALLSTLFPIAAIAAPSSPRDLPPGHWAAGPVKRLVHENILGTTPDGRFQGDQPVTRYELAVALDRFVRYIEAGRQPLHAQTFPAPTSLPQAATSVQRQALVHLVSNGFLPSDSPLLSPKGSPLVTATQLSDALASVTIRLSDRAEAPDKN